MAQKILCWNTIFAAPVPRAIGAAVRALGMEHRPLAQKNKVQMPGLSTARGAEEQAKYGGGVRTPARNRFTAIETLYFGLYVLDRWKNVHDVLKHKLSG